MAFSNPAAGVYAEQLRTWGCLRIRVTDRKQLPAERTKVEFAATSLGRQSYSSYRYPYLYVRLGEPLAIPVGQVLGDAHAPDGGGGGHDPPRAAGSTPMTGATTTVSAAVRAGVLAEHRSAVAREAGPVRAGGIGSERA